MQISCGSSAKDVFYSFVSPYPILYLDSPSCKLNVPNKLLSDYNFIPSFFVGVSSLTLSNTTAGCSVNNSEVKELSGFQLY